MDPIIAEQFGVQTFALAVVIGKIITYITLLALAVIVEVGLVRRVYEAEFGKKKTVALGRFTDALDWRQKRHLRTSDLMKHGIEYRRRKRFRGPRPLPKTIATHIFFC